MDTKRLFNKAVNLLTLASFLVWNLSVAAPEGGSVAQGSATVSQSGTLTTVNQTSQNAVINWNSFNTASNEAVKFSQPNSSAIALNRITNGQPTQFAGQLSANGNVWILNPAGVLFTSTSRVDVAGLLATTHNITDSNFMAGNYQFNVVPGFDNASIINNGLISAKDSGIVALVAPYVQNNGLIQVNLGKVSLSSGSEFVLDMYGDSLINFGSSASIANGSVSNAGQIIANGGKVFMTANAAAGVLDNVISMTGTIQARSVTNGPHGEIILNGGKSGTVRVSGKLNTSGSNGAVGGTIETSGDNVIVDSMAEINAGVGGEWILDPPLIYTSTWEGIISDELNMGTNVKLSTGVSGSGAGDIYVDTAISWSTSAVLMLGAYRNINISAPITASNNGGFIARADLSANGSGTVNFSGSGSVTVNGANGYAKLFYNPTSYATPTDYTGFLLGSAPIKAGYMMINTQADLLAAGAVGSSSIVYSYALNNDIDMAGVSLSSSIFNSNFGNNFQGNFEGHNYADGLNKTISNITLSTGGGGVGALMTYINGRIDNLTLSNLSLTAGGNYGGLVWSNNGTLSNVHVSGNLVGTSSSGGGGITGENQGVIKNSWFSGTINSSGLLYIGGITGYLNTGASIIDSYNEGSVTGDSAGGIVGLMIGASTIMNVYNVGAISGGGSAAIIGAANVGGSTISGVYWDTTTSSVGSPYGGSFAGSYFATALTDAQMKVAANFPTFDFVNTWTTSGDTTYPQLITFPNNIIDSTQIAGNIGVAAAGQTVNIYADNVSIGTAVVNGSGEYYMNFDPNAVYVANPTIILATTSGTVTGDYLGKFYGPVGNMDIVNNQITVRSDTGVAILNSEVAAQTNVNLYAGSGNDILLNSNASFLTTAGAVYSSVFTTTATPYNLNGNIDPGIDVTFNGPVTVTVPGASITNTGNTTFVSTLDGPDDLTINSNGSVTFEDNVGTSPALSALTVTAGNGIIVNPNANSHTVFNVITSGNQIYNGNIQLTQNTIAVPPAVATDNFQSTTGDITFNGPVTLLGSSRNIQLMMNAGNNIHINGSILMDPTPNTFLSGGTIDFTAGGAIYINTTTIDVGNQGDAGSTLFSGFFRSPVYLSQDLTLTTSVGGYMQILSTVDTDPSSLVAHSLTINSPEALLDIWGNMGASHPLSSITIGSVGSVIIRFINPTTPIEFVTTGNQSYTQIFFSSFFPGITVDTPALTFTSTGNGLISFSGGMASFLPNATIQINGNAFLQGNTSYNPNFFNNSGVSGSLAITVTGDTEMDNVIFASQAGNQIYLGNVTVTDNSASLSTTSGHIEFGANVNSVTANNSAALSLSTPSGYTQFDGVVNVATGTDPLASLTISDPIVFNGSTYNVDNFTFASAIGVTALGGIVNDATGVTFSNTIDGFAVGNAGALTVNANTTFDNTIGATTALGSLSVTGSSITLNTNIINTTGNQIYTGAVILMQNIEQAGPAAGMIAGGNIQFNGTVDGNFDLFMSATGTVEFDGAVGGTPLTSLDVTGLQINVNTSSIDTSGDQAYRSPVSLLVNSTLTSDNSNITFNSTVNGPGGLIINVTNGTMFAEGDMGSGTPVGYLTVNGTAQGVNVISVGDIIMGPFNVVTNDMVQSLSGNVDFTGGPVTLSANLDVIAANQIFFGAGANGVTGPFALSAQSLNSTYGSTGQGITGTVNVASLTVGGPGGANLSQNYPTTESFVATQGAGQAIMNTVISPDFSSSGAIYCVNNFCALVPVPPVNNLPTNIPQLELFNFMDGASYCSGSGCSNLEIIMDNVAEVGVVNCVFGFMEAVSESGSVRILMPGDMLYAGDTVKGSGNSQMCVKDVSSGREECHQGSGA